jgi:hypothetical protein
MASAASSWSGRRGERMPAAVSVHPLRRGGMNANRDRIAEISHRRSITRPRRASACSSLAQLGLPDPSGRR